MKIQATAPGKLYIAGEYAVVEAGHSAVIAAVDRYLIVTLTQAKTGVVHSSQRSDLEVKWTRENGKITALQEHPYDLVFAALACAETFSRESGCDLLPRFRLDIESELDDAQTGTKFGLGSSAAVTVAVVKAVLALYGLSRPMTVYKLAALAQTMIGVRGSFGDLAAASFGGVIAYSSPDRDWLTRQVAAQSVSDLVRTDWPGLRIEPLQLPAGLELLVGWTGSAASTSDLVGQVQNERTQEEKDAFYQQFLVASQACVAQLVAACRSNQPALFKQALADNRRLLAELAAVLGMTIETPLLTKLCDLALQAGAAAKSSGAGGGDCGICFVESSSQADQIRTDWQSAGIQPLDLHIDA